MSNHFVEMNDGKKLNAKLYWGCFVCKKKFDNTKDTHCQVNIHKNNLTSSITLVHSQREKKRWRIIIMMDDVIHCWKHKEYARAHFNRFIRFLFWFIASNSRQNFKIHLQFFIEVFILMRFQISKYYGHLLLVSHFQFCFIFSALIQTFIDPFNICIYVCVFYFIQTISCLIFWNCNWSHARIQ